MTEFALTIILLIWIAAWLRLTWTRGVKYGAEGHTWLTIVTLILLAIDILFKLLNR